MTPRGAPDGIVVLGGALEPRSSRRRAARSRSTRRPNADGRRRARAALSDARIIFSGGTGALISASAAEARIRAAAVRELRHRARARIALEDHSRNTVENARFTQALVKPKPGERWLLVTSAYHMPRSVGVFRKAGFRGRGLSGRLAHPRRAATALRPFGRFGDGLRPHRHRDARMGRAAGLLADRPDLGAVSGAAASPAAAGRAGRRP